MTRFIATKTCGRCGATIYLIKAVDHYEWVTDLNKNNAWRCGNDPLHPVLAHAPKEELGG
jgi:hypothetical protein